MILELNHMCTTEPTRRLTGSCLWNDTCNGIRSFTFHCNTIKKTPTKTNIKITRLVYTRKQKLTLTITIDETRRNHRHSANFKTFSFVCQWPSEERTFCGSACAKLTLPKEYFNLWPNLWISSTWTDCVLSTFFFLKPRCNLSVAKSARLVCSTVGTSCHPT